MTEVPRYVVASTADAAVVLRRLIGAGWRARKGFTLAGDDLPGARLVLFGRVADRQTARLAVTAAVRGAGVVAVVDTSTGLAAALVGDLSRLGPVRRGPQERASLTLVPEQRALLQRLAAGQTIAAAAAAEFLSLRTANRRIAQARQVLGARTTREAVMAYVRQSGDS